MNKRKIVKLCTLVLTIILALAPIEVLALDDENISEENSMLEYYIDEPYVYPTVPGTDAWNALTSRVEKGNVCEIPNVILDNMTTNALLESYLNYPLLGDIFAWPTTTIGFSVLLKSFNGLRELVIRDDLTDILQTYIQQYSNYDTPEFSYERFKKYEALLCLEVYISGVNSSTLSTDSLPGSDATVYTPAGSACAAWKDSTFYTIAFIEEEDEAEYIASQEAEYARDYPSAVKIGEVDPKYSCHSYAVYGQGYANSYWINNPSVFYTDGSYVQVSDSIYPQYVLYYDSSIVSNTGLPYVHSAIQISATTFKSKWGAMGVYLHTLHDCPYYDAAYSISNWRLNSLYWEEKVKDQFINE